MIFAMKKWCEGLIVAIIISIIIEMLIPENKTKKYIKVIIGIYIIFVILSPLFKIFDYKFDELNIFEFETTSSDIHDEIKDVYVIGIEQSIKKEIEELGFLVGEINLFIDEKYENIEKIELKVKEKLGIVEPVIIDTEKEKIDYSKIIKHLEENYFIKSENIIFK